MTYLRTLFPPIYPLTVYWNSNTISLFFNLLLRGEIGKGHALQELREKLINYLKVYDFFPTNRGKTAIKLALKAFRQISTSQKDEVLLPIYICSSVVKAITDVRLKPKFVNIKKDLNICVDDLKKSLSSKILAVIVPHIYGYPAPIKEVIKIIKNYDKSIFVIDDAASAFGIKYNNNFLGTFGDVGIISFGQAKMLTASGGGGLIVNNPYLKKPLYEIYKNYKNYKNWEKTKEFLNSWWLYKLRRYSDVIDYFFKRITKHHFYFSKNSLDESKKLSNLDAAIVIQEFPKMNVVHKKRSQIIHFYIKELKELENFGFISIPQKDAHLYHVSRFYILTHGLMVSRDPEGRILEHNPLAKYLLYKGIKTQYGYCLPYKNFQALEIYKKNSWIESLLMLPINHTKPIQKYKFVVSAIKSFYNAK